MELISKLWKKRMMIIKWCVVGAIIGLVAGFSIPKTYKAGATLAPETEQRMGSGVSSIASMMGVSLDNSVDAISVEMFPDVVASTPFIYGLFDLPVTFERKDSVITTDLLDYMLEYQKSPWWSYIVQAPFKALGWVMSIGKEKESDELPAELNPQNLPKKVRGVVKYFRENISVVVDKKTGKTEISLEMQDPLVVATVVEAVMENLKDYMSDYRTSKVRQDVENLSLIYEQRKQDYYAAQQAYAQYMDANKNVILQSAQAERERLRAEKRAANPDGITENTSKKKLQQKQRAEEEAARAAAAREYAARKGILEEEVLEEKQTLSGIAERPYCKGRAYDPNRYNSSEE